MDEHLYGTGFYTWTQRQAGHLRGDLFRDACGTARRQAALGTRLDRRLFPLDPPSTVDEAEAEDFWPSRAP